MTARRTASAGRRPDIEKMLTDRGFSWEYRHDVPVEDIDVAKSRANQARLGAAVAVEVVDRYKAALSNGDLFPAIITAKQRRGGLLIVDGNHRHEAHQQVGKPIDAYVLTNANAAAITQLTFEANTKHGLPTSETERIHQALTLVDMGLSDIDAARRLGLKLGALRAARNVSEAGARADREGISRVDWDRLPNGHQVRLNQIYTDEGFAAMAKLAIAAKLTQQEVNEAIRGLSDLKSSNKQVEYIKGLVQVYAERVQTGGIGEQPKVRGRQVRTPRQTFGLVLGQISTLPPVEAITGRLSAPEREEMAERVDAAIEALTSVRNALG